VVLDPPRAIGWLTGTKGDGRLEFGGWIWRYDLAPLGPSESLLENSGSAWFGGGRVPGKAAGHDDDH
jgi:hypothetical protein